MAWRLSISREEGGDVVVDGLFVAREASANLAIWQEV